MFAKIATFELRYQLKNPVFWVVSILFFLLTFGAMTVDGIQIGSGGNVNANSPVAIIRIHLIQTLFFMFVTTAFVANVIVRDDESGFGPMVRSTRVRKFDYLIGRFAGAFLAASIAFLTVPIAIWLGSLMPWLDPETLGPNRFSHYAFAYIVMALPGIFLTSCIFFAVATLTRSMMYSYLGVVVLLVLYIVFNVSTDNMPELRDLTGYADPFGIAAFNNVIRYWTASESNSLVPPMGGVILWNRLIWIGFSLLCLAFAYRWFSFAERGVSARKAKRQAKKAAKLATVKPLLVEHLPDGNVNAAAWAHLVSRTRFEMVQVFKSPAFVVLLIIGLFNASAALMFTNEIYGTPSRPLTFVLLIDLIGAFGIIPLIIAIYYAGELVWRDRDRKMHEIIDSTPLPNWAYMVPKTIAVSGVLFATILISMIAAVLIQLARGFTDVALDQYVMWYLLPWGVDMIILAVLAVFVQALSPNKYVGWAIMVLYLVATITFSAIGLEHPLYLYGNAAPSPLFSDLNGNNVNGMVGWWLRLYWGAIAVILAALAHLLWRRGTEVNLLPRLRQLPRRLVSATGALILGAGLTAASSGAFIYNNTNVMNDFLTQSDREQRLADYEKKYLKYEDIRQPSTTDITLKVDIYPEQKRMTASGTMVIVNDTGAPVEALHVRFPDTQVKVESITIADSSITLDDPAMKYWIYALDTPMAEGETRTVSFETSREQRGFRASGNDTRLVRNGTFLNNSEFAPQLGMDRNGLLQDRQTRREYGLAPELRQAKLEDESAREKNYVANADWVTSDITVSTHKDQTPIAPGSKVSDEIRGDRRVARFVSEQPILAFFSVQSAEYAVKEREADGVDIAVYYHPKHDYNVDIMLNAIEASLAYYKANFGPYQFDYARIIEFPGYDTFAQAFAGTVPYSERLGFIADNSDPNAIDYVTYVTAHEFGHQYWAHQLISADQQGGTLLIETLAQYSALMVMKDMYGEDQIRRFLKYELDRYLSARGSEVIEELPLNRVENQGYIHYRKGAVVMYLLQDRLGEDRVNAMLAGLLDQYRFKSQPYANSYDLVDGFKSLARNQLEHQLVTDMLEKITIYDLKADSVDVREMDDGSFETTLTIVAEKFYADGQGKETKARLDDSIDVGLFTARPGLGAFGKADVLSMQRQPVRSGRQQITIRTSQKPEYVGIDPYNKYIDRNSDDNVIAVTAS
ncbi:MAG: M1 family aminopeptidase [Pseudomonadota bacterium]